jgi:hypothetical protein
MTDYVLDIRSSISGKEKRDSLLHSAQTGSEAHLSYPMGTGGIVLEVKAAGA